MAYVPCHACGKFHKNIPQDEIVKLLDEFQAGNGQRVTGNGIETLCILDILDVPVNMRARKENNVKPSESTSAYQRSEYITPALASAR